MGKTFPQDSSCVEAASGSRGGFARRPERLRLRSTLPDPLSDHPESCGGVEEATLQVLRPRTLQSAAEPRPVWKPWKQAGTEPRSARAIELERELGAEGTLALVQEVRALCDEARDAFSALV